MNKRLLLVALACFFVSGCAFVNIPLYVTPQPLQEKVLEGEGKTKDPAGRCIGVPVRNGKGQGVDLQRRGSSALTVERGAPKSREG